MHYQKLGQDCDIRPQLPTSQILRNKLRGVAVWLLSPSYYILTAQPGTETRNYSALVQSAIVFPIVRQWRNGGGTVKCFK